MFREYVLKYKVGKIRVWKYLMDYDVCYHDLIMMHLKDPRVRTDGSIIDIGLNDRWECEDSCLNRFVYIEADDV